MAAYPDLTFYKDSFFGEVLTDKNANKWLSLASDEIDTLTFGRLTFAFPIVEAHIEKVKKVISDIIENHPLALKDPAPFVRLSAHSDNALTYTARVWVKSADYWDIYFDVTESVKVAFDKNDIKIPYNQLDVHIDNK